MAETPTTQMIAQQKAEAAKSERKGKKSFKENLLGGKIGQLQEQLDQYKNLDDQGLMALTQASRVDYADVNKYRQDPRYKQTRVNTGSRKDTRWTDNLSDILSSEGYSQDNSGKWHKVTQLSNEERLAQGKNVNLKRIADLQAKIANPESLVTDKFEQDMLKGARFGESVLGEEGLGRLAEDVDIQEAMQRYKDIADKGLSRSEVEAEKSQAFKEIQGSTETARRQLQAQLARMGVRGGVAGSQVRDVLMQGMNKQADVSRDLFLKSEQIKRQGLQDYSSRLGEMKTFDLGQEAAEKNIVLQAGLGIAQVGSAERAAKYAAEQQRLAAQARSAASSCFLKTTMIELKDGNKKPINEVALGDELKTGHVTGVLAFIKNEEMYDVNGTHVSGSHYVFDTDGVWKSVRDLGLPEMETEEQIVYTLTTTSGTIEINGILFADHEGFMNEGSTDKYILREMNEFTKNVLSREVRNAAN